MKTAHCLHCGAELLYKTNRKWWCSSCLTDRRAEQARYAYHSDPERHMAASNRWRNKNRDRVNARRRDASEGSS